ncbi:MAG: right-handed parallel beta-helix repeat-containing protein, partial [Ferruginibacter sp.]
MKVLPILLLLISSSVFAGNVYYVSNTGNDAANGLTTGTAWLTIAKVNSFVFAANDTILFKRGDSFYGGIIVKRANLNFGAYGNGAKPVITGLSPITGWVNLGGNIWEAPTVKVKATNNLVLRNRVIQQVGRYPNADVTNKGYLTYTAATSTSITGPALSSVTNWSGAEVVIRFVRWDIIRAIVTSHSAGKVNFASIGQTPRVNYGYFFQRDPRTLDQDGEWWQDGSNNKLRMYFSNNDPGAYTIEAATVDTLFNSQFGALSLTNISFYGSGKHGVRINGGTDIIVRNCDFNMSGSEALSVLSSSNVLVDACTTDNSLG